MRSEMSVVLPAPVCPTTATVSPGSMANVTSRSTQSGWDTPDASSLAVAGVRADPLPAAAFEFCSAGRANGPGPTGTLRPSELLSGATLRYANHTWSNSILPGPLGVFVTGGDTTSTGA